VKSNCTNTEWVGRAKCSVCEVRNLVLFSGLTPAELDGLLQPIDNLHAPAQATLYQKDAAATHVYTVRSGLVKLTVDLPNGMQRIVRLLRPGDVAGSEALPGGQYRHHAVVLRDADVCRIPVEVVRQLDQTNPAVHRALLERWQRAVDQADNFIAALSTGSAEARLARLLLGMACEQDLHAAVSLSREDMGAVLGVTTETASRAMAEFKRRGLVREEKGICVACDRKGLEAIANR
jgi:CRP/FNR family transcriptional regulator